MLQQTVSKILSLLLELQKELFVIKRRHTQERNYGFFAKTGQLNYIL